LKKGWSCQVSDFGLSRYLDIESAAKTQNHWAFDSKWKEWKWMAPESIISQEYSYKSDMWMFGCTLIELLTQGNDPFPDASNPMEVINAVATSGLRPSPPENCPPSLGALLSECFTADPKKRPSFPHVIKQLENIDKEIKENPFYSPTLHKSNE